MLKNSFHAHHINATPADFEGNNGIGPYIFIPGSDARAQQIAEFFDQVTVKQHHRGHHLYLGTLQTDEGKIKVGTISSGIGSSSIEIILHELHELGAKRFLRLGTAGSLQPDLIQIGSIINAQAAVRDEGTTPHYVHPEFPAIASLEFVTSILVAAENMGIESELHTGIVHTKGSLYAREFHASPLANKHTEYFQLLTETGVLATEMECAPLFIQSQLYNYQLSKLGEDPSRRVLAGALLAINGMSSHIEENEFSHQTIQNTILLALETVKVLASQELNL